MSGLASLIVLSGCVPPAAPGPTSSSPSAEVEVQVPDHFPQQQYETAIRSSGRSLPDGYEWPVDYPPAFFDGGPSSELPYRTNRLWGCIVIKAAWDAADQGDRARADSLLGDLRTANQDWDIDFLSDWDNNERPVGDSGLCLAGLRGVDVSPRSETGPND